MEELLAEKIWRKVGMEQSAYNTVDALGIAFSGGGLNAGLRDMARLGELIRNQGKWHGQQIIPTQALKSIAQEGSREAFARSPYINMKGWSYRAMWWHTGNEHGAFAARGVHGQTIYIDPKAEMVLVRFASYPVAANGANDPTSLPAYHEVAKYLLTKP